MKFYDIVLTPAAPVRPNTKRYAQFTLCTIQGREEANAHCKHLRTVFPNDDLHVGTGYDKE